MERTALVILTALRAVGGVGSWFRPGLTVRFFGFEHDPSNDFLNRLSGAREMAFAAGPALARGAGRRQWLWLALACDTLDTGAVGLAVRAGHFSRSEGTGLAGFTLLCGALTSYLLAGNDPGAA
jgi:hypothetical protein